MKCPIHNLEMHYAANINQHACQVPSCKYASGVYEKDIDPFEREKLIRSGRLDDHMPSYEELTGWLQRVSITYLPALMARTIEAAAIRKVFKDKEAQKRVCLRAIEGAGNYFREDEHLEDAKPAQPSDET